MVEGGAVAAGRVGGRLVFERAVLDDLARVERKRGRPLGARMAWMVLLQASDEPIPRGVGRGARRASELLASRGLEGMRHGLKGRGGAQRFSAHPSALGRLRELPEVVLSGISAGRHHELGIASSEEVEGYIRASDLENVQRRYALAPASDGPVVLRAVDDDAWMIRGEFAPIAAAALDLADARDARSRELGEQTLKSLDADRLHSAADERSGRT
jgi:hypothetical protein